jgi:CRP/FNR family transcriptional regulator, cyclic AMP receptor protein
MDILLQEGWLSRCPSEFQRAVLTAGRRRSFAAKHFVYHIGDAPAGIFGVASGAFALISAAERSEPHLSHLVRSGGWFGEGPLLTGEPRRVAAQARMAGEVFALPLKQIAALCATNPAWHRHFAALAFENLSIAIGVISDLQLQRSAARIAAALLRAAGCTVLAPGRKPVPVPLSQSDLGEMANVSRQVVNATLRQWQGAGWISVRYGEVVVREIEELRQCTAV